MKTSLVLGAGGFIGHHLVLRLKKEGAWVRGVDLRFPRPSFRLDADDFQIRDLRDPDAAMEMFAMQQPFDEVYQLAADMGGAGYIFSGENDAAVMHNSASINLNVLNAAHRFKAGRIFFSSSACIYPEHNQRDPLHPTTEESTAYPAAPDSEYGWEKLFSERLYLAYARNHGMTVRIARYHNIFGPECAWNDGREKAPAAVCRKVAECPDGGTIDIWGDGKQTRSFLDIDECLTGTLKLMRHTTFTGPVNIGSDHAISIDDLVRMVADIAGKRIAIRHIDGPTGVRGRVSDNRLVQVKLHWFPAGHPFDGLRRLYAWVAEQVEAAK